MEKCLSLNGCKTYIYWKIPRDITVPSDTGIYQDVLMLQKISESDITCNQCKKKFRLYHFQE